jgi:hypothetical protein
MSSLIPNLAEAAPFFGRALPWLFAFDALLVIGVLIGAIAMMKFRARLTVEEARRVADITPYRDFHRNLVWARRCLMTSALVVVSGVLAALVAGHLPRHLLELFIVIFFGALCLPLYFAIYVLAETFRLTADRLDQLLASSEDTPKQRVVGS